VAVKLFNDANANVVQAIELADDAVAIAVGTGTSTDVLPTGAEIVRIGIDVDCYIKFGDASVTVTLSNGHYFPKGVEVLVVPEAATHMANLSADGSSTGNGTMASVAGTHYNN
jgi:hypothetical protein